MSTLVDCGRWRVISHLSQAISASIVADGASSVISVRPSQPRLWQMARHQSSQSGHLSLDCGRWRVISHRSQAISASIVADGASSVISVRPSQPRLWQMARHQSSQSGHLSLDCGRWRVISHLSQAISASIVADGASSVISVRPSQPRLWQMARHQSSQSGHLSLDCGRWRVISHRSQAISASIVADGASSVISVRPSQPRLWQMARHQSSQSGHLSLDCGRWRVISHLSQAISASIVADGASSVIAVRPSQPRLWQMARHQSSQSGHLSLDCGRWRVISHLSQAISASIVADGASSVISVRPSQPRLWQMARHQSSQSGHLSLDCGRWRVISHRSQAISASIVADGTSSFISVRPSQPRLWQMARHQSSQSGHLSLDCGRWRVISHLSQAISASIVADGASSVISVRPSQPRLWQMARHQSSQSGHLSLDCGRWRVISHLSQAISASIVADGTSSFISVRPSQPRLWQMARHQSSQSGHLSLDCGRWHVIIHLSQAISASIVADGASSVISVRPSQPRLWQMARHQSSQSGHLSLDCGRWHVIIHLSQAISASIVADGASSVISVRPSQPRLWQMARHQSSQSGHLSLDCGRWRVISHLSQAISASIVADGTSSFISVRPSQPRLWQMARHQSSQSGHLSIDCGRWRVISHLSQAISASIVADGASSVISVRPSQPRLWQMARHQSSQSGHLSLDCGRWRVISHRSQAISASIVADGTSSFISVRPSQPRLWQMARHQSSQSGHLSIDCGRWRVISHLSQAISASIVADGASSVIPVRPSQPRLWQMARHQSSQSGHLSLDCGRWRVISHRSQAISASIVADGASSVISVRPSQHRLWQMARHQSSQSGHLSLDCGRWHVISHRSQAISASIVADGASSVIAVRPSQPRLWQIARHQSSQSGHLSLDCGRWRVISHRSQAISASIVADGTSSVISVRPSQPRLWQMARHQSSQSGHLSLDCGRWRVISHLSQAISASIVADGASSVISVRPSQHRLWQMARHQSSQSGHLSLDCGRWRVISHRSQAISASIVADGASSSSVRPSSQSGHLSLDCGRWRVISHLSQAISASIVADGASSVISVRPSQPRLWQMARHQSSQSGHLSLDCGRWRVISHLSQAISASIVADGASSVISVRPSQPRLWQMARHQSSQSGHLSLDCGRWRVISHLSQAISASIVADGASSVISVRPSQPRLWQMARHQSSQSGHLSLDCGRWHVIIHLSQAISASIVADGTSSFISVRPSQPRLWQMARHQSSQSGHLSLDCGRWRVISHLSQAISASIVADGASSVISVRPSQPRLWQMARHQSSQSGHLSLDCGRWRVISHLSQAISASIVADGASSVISVRPSHPAGRNRMHLSCFLNELFRRDLVLTVHASTSESDARRCYNVLIDLFPHVASAICSLCAMHIIIYYAKLCIIITRH